MSRLAILKALWCLILFVPGGVSAEQQRYDAFAEVLKTFVDPEGMVDYSGLQKSRESLDAFADELARFPKESYEKLGEEEQIAFWINAYNALTLKAIIDNYPIKSGFFTSLAFPKNSIRQIKGVWDDLKFEVMGEKRTLNEIEHEILRKEFKEPRIHVALVCAAKSCPRLRNEPYYGERLEEQFADQTKHFLNSDRNFRVSADEQTVRLSKIFDWFGEDFIGAYPWQGDNPGYGGKEQAVLAFIGPFLPPEQSEQLRAKKFDVEYADYDWSLNEQGAD